MSTIVQAAVFAAGALIGGGVTAAVLNKKPQPAAVDGTIVSPAVSTVTPPIIGLGTNGNAQISTLSSVASLSSSAVLKYGNPGARFPLIIRVSRSKCVL